MSLGEPTGHPDGPDPWYRRPSRRAASAPDTDRDEGQPRDGDGQGQRAASRERWTGNGGGEYNAPGSVPLLCGLRLWVERSVVGLLELDRGVHPQRSVQASPLLPVDGP